MPVVDALILENISTQVVKVMVQQARDKGFATTETLSTATSGLVAIPPTKKITVQLDRVSEGQVANFEGKGLLKVTRTRV